MNDAANQFPKKILGHRKISGKKSKNRFLFYNFSKSVRITIQHDGIDSYDDFTS